MPHTLRRERWGHDRETRLPVISQTLDADAVIEKVKENHPSDEFTSLLIYLPQERIRHFEVSARFRDSGRFSDRLHPETGESLGESKSRAGSGFIYTMHYRQYIPGGIGYFAVAFGALFMMILLVTGVIIHRKIFVDFFTFRPKKKMRRSSLDLHNVTGVLFLPFHFLICLSGLAIFAGFYISLPFAISNAFSESDRAVELFYASGDYAYYQRDAVDKTTEIAHISPFVARAEAIWTERYGQDVKADRIDITHYGDVNAYVAEF